MTRGEYTHELSFDLFNQPTSTSTLINLISTLYSFYISSQQCRSTIKMTIIDIDQSVTGTIITTSTPPAHLSDIPIKETPSRPSKSRSRSQSLGSTKQVEKDNTFRIYRPVQCGPPFVFPERKADTMNKEEEKHPAYSLVKPPKVSHGGCIRGHGADCLVQCHCARSPCTSTS